jgi:pimeloyl-ACP methyl ester carboxylesterase
MSTYVLVHGAWHGSWCWKRVRKALQAQGHEVFTPTLTGVAERKHLLSPQINLDTHIDDVVNLIQWEELSDVVLCGHSYGGPVISGVADRIPDRIGALSLSGYIRFGKQPEPARHPAAGREEQATGSRAARWGRLESAAHPRRSIQGERPRCRLGEPPMHHAAAGDLHPTPQAERKN